MNKSYAMEIISRQSIWSIVYRTTRFMRSLNNGSRDFCCNFGLVSTFRQYVSNGNRFWCHFLALLFLAIFFTRFLTLVHCLNFCGCFFFFLFLFRSSPRALTTVHWLHFRGGVVGVLLVCYSILSSFWIVTNIQEFWKCLLAAAATEQPQTLYYNVLWVHLQQPQHP